MVEESSEVVQLVAKGERSLDSLMEEGKAFREHRVSWQQENNPKAGTAVYLVSKKWVDTYKRYVFYKELHTGRQPQPESNHCEAEWPGPIANSELLNIDDKHLKGTGTDKDFEAATVDSYLKSDVREVTDYEIFSVTMWNFAD